MLIKKQGENTAVVTWEFLPLWCFQRRGAQFLGICSTFLHEHYSTQFRHLRINSVPSSLVTSAIQDTPEHPECVIGQLNCAPWMRRNDVPSMAL